MTALPVEPVPPPLSLSISGAFDQGWAAFKVYYGVLLGTTLIYLLLSMAIGVLQNLIEKQVGFPILSLPIALLVSAQLASGYSYFGVRCARGAEVKVEDLFWGFRRYWTIAGVQGLVMLLSITCAIPILVGTVFLFGLSGARGGAAGAGLIVFIACALVGLVLLFVIALRFSFAAMAALDEHGTQPGVMDALRLSWRMTASPNWWLVAVLGLILALLVFATMAACLLPALFLGVPLAATIWGATYDHLAMGQGIGAAAEPA